MIARAFRGSRRVSYRLIAASERPVATSHRVLPTAFRLDAIASPLCRCIACTVKAKAAISSPERWSLGRLEPGSCRCLRIRCAALHNVGCATRIQFRDPAVTALLSIWEHSSALRDVASVSSLGLRPSVYRGLKPAVRALCLPIRCWVGELGVQLPWRWVIRDRYRCTRVRCFFRPRACSSHATWHRPRPCSAETACIRRERRCQASLSNSSTSARVQIDRARVKGAVTDAARARYIIQAYACAAS